ncbi:unnamed protein product [Caenorhabditis sp. 36 PRJEB53466]|nr:unnamed protein product [Caenorhabditis sp. 36 PRJEB53466]
MNYRAHGMAPLKVYVASATANPETKYRVQRTLMILDGLGIPFDAIDITKPEHAEERVFMRENASKKGANGSVLPPQFFYNDEYLGDYEDFDISVEADTITEFLRLLPDVIESNVNTNPETQENSAIQAAKPEGEEKTDENELEGEDEEWDEEDEEYDEEAAESGRDKQQSEKKLDEIEKEKPTTESPVAEKANDDEELEGEDEEYDDEDEEDEGKDEGSAE